MPTSAPGKRYTPRRRTLPDNTFAGPRFGIWGRTQPVGRSWLAKRAATAAALWELSEQLTSTKFPL